MTRLASLYPLVLPAFLIALHQASSAAPAGGLRAAFRCELEAIRDDYNLPGITAAYVLNDGTFNETACGWADIEKGRPMKPSDRMLAASIGKTFLAASVVSLACEGKLDLSAPVVLRLGARAWYARLANHSTITPRHLLTHSAGLPDHVQSDAFRRAVAAHWTNSVNPFPPEALVGFILDEPPLFVAGEGWSYSDTGYILLGLFAETITGRSCTEEINDRFIQPLGLHSTDPSDRRVLPGLATGYVDPQNPFGFPRQTVDTKGAMTWHPGIEWMGGGWVSTAGDLARWGVALYSGQALPDGAIEILLDAVPVQPGESSPCYGAGVVVRHGGIFGTTLGHRGWIPGYCSSLLHYPDYGVTIAFQTNTDIGLTRSERDIMGIMEKRLAQIVMGTPVEELP